MTKDEWAKVKETLSCMGQKVILKIDGYEVKLRLQQQTVFENCIAVFVNGEISLKWAYTECEERVRFLEKKVIKSFSEQKIYNDKSLTKREKKELVKHLNEKCISFVGYELGWGNFEKMKKHLIKNNKSIELVSLGGY